MAAPELPPAPAPPPAGSATSRLLCSNMQTMEHFYCDVLGYEVEWRPSPEELYMTRGEDNLALHARRERRGSHESRLDHIGLLLSRPEDVDAWAAYLQRRGVKLDTSPRTHRDGARSFYARDPEGNRLQFPSDHPPTFRVRNSTQQRGSSSRTFGYA